MENQKISLFRIEVTCHLKEETRKAQKLDPTLQSKKGQLALSEASDGTVLFWERICVPKSLELRSSILEEVYRGKLSIHPGATKMYQDLKMFWWPGMKRDIAEFVSKCLICQQVKIEH